VLQYECSYINELIYVFQQHVIKVKLFADEVQIISNVDIAYVQHAIFFILT